MKKILFYIFIGLLSLPALQRQFPVFEASKLNGSIKPAKDIAFSFDLWFTAEYQSLKERYIKENIGFRSIFIKSYNQLLFSLFKEANNPGGVVGDEGYLYLESYIYNHTGENYVGDNRVHLVSKRLKYLQDYFEEQGISLLTVFVPSKASFFPEYIPEQYKIFTQSNYTAYVSSFDSLSVNYIDLNTYLISLKNKSTYPLFSRTGLHWTSYAMALGMDSLLRKVEEIRGLDLPEFSWEKPVKMSHHEIAEDHDAENLMNLFFDLTQDSMPYPQFSFYSDSSKTKPKTLVISDSYYWRPFKAKIPHHVFDWGGFWYYFNTARWQENSINKKKAVSKIDIEKKLLEQDVIILFASQATLHIFPYKFDKKVFPIFMPKDKESLINYFTENLYSNKKGLIKIQAKANVNQFSLEEQIYRDANWLTKIYLNENPQEDKYLEIVNKIKKDPKWMASIKKKAEKRGVSVEEMLQKDARWIYNKKLE